MTLRAAIETLIASLRGFPREGTPYERGFGEGAEWAADRLSKALAEDAGGWRSMDSAPVDGTRVLLRLGDPCNETVIRRWSDDEDFWICDDDNHCTGARVPVAWMPLPEPPPQEPPQ